MSIYDVPVKTLEGEPATLADHAGEVLLIVNVASKCGLTPQYETLEALQRTYADQGFSVLGFPCNQFGGQEPGTAEEIQTFCSSTYGVSFPLYEKLDVNGVHQHPLYGELTQVPDAAGDAGEVMWNFEKFLVGRDGNVVARFRPRTTPDDPTVLAALEGELASPAAS